MKLNVSSSLGNYQQMHSIFILIIISFLNVSLFAQYKSIAVTEEIHPGSFALAANGKVATIITDTADAEVVSIAVSAFQKDIQAVTGFKSLVSHNISKSNMVIVGTLGESFYIDQLAAKNLIPADKVRNKWEAFCITVIKNPFPNVKSALVIFGSNPRSTAFGLFDLSRMMGVSPMVWWADVIPGHKKALFVTNGTKLTSPSVQYRGIFINDEDWGMQPWAAKNMDTDIKDIGPKTYEKVFEMMLRIKANYIWPAMHECTKAFWYYPGNPEMARKYDIILGASHCEPLLRNNPFEWSRNFKNEYGVAPKEWRYDHNKEQIDKYWDDRVKQSRNNPSVYTVGMRGIHDSGMPGPASKEEKKVLLQEVIKTQRKILSTELSKPASDIPQIFCPYKEVLDIYRLGMKLPEDITLAWADDNYGYVRQLSTPEEQLRSGGSGVYYHFSYWGGPQEYLWLSTISPMLTSYELTKAYQLNAKKLWVFNMGDIKPAELELQFAMDFAWDVNAWTPENAYKYLEYWAQTTFGSAFAKSIGHIKQEYYRLAATAKPEHLGRVKFTDAETNKRLKDYQALVQESKIVAEKIPARLKDAYFELVAYPVEACASMNEKVLDARKSLKMATEGNKEALNWSTKSKAAFENIKELTKHYNKDVAGGKWDGMMSYNPRGIAIFDMPKVATPGMIASKVSYAADTNNTIITIQASSFLKQINSRQLKVLKGLGVEKEAVTVWPMVLKSFTEIDINDAPYAEYRIRLMNGANKLIVKCLSDFPLYTGMKLRYAISVDGTEPEFVNIATLAETKSWSENILKGYAVGETSFKNSKEGDKIIRIYFPDPGLVISSINVVTK